MKPLFLLDFDGVLFNSAYEAYTVCEQLANQHQEYRKHVPFEEFMVFRAKLTDAWQFCRLYQKNRLLPHAVPMQDISPDEQDWLFTERFFAARAEMMMADDWAKVMSPYPIFYQLRPWMRKFQSLFKILSTRNRLSITRTLHFFELSELEVYGQEDIRTHGSKLEVARHHGWLNDHQYVVYVDDMNSHLEPFEKEVNLCLHAGWGYDRPGSESYTQNQVMNVIGALLSVAFDKTAED
jgi:hypothetical protein